MSLQYVIKLFYQHTLVFLGAPRLLQSIAKDNVIPILSPFARVTKNNEPFLGLVFFYFIFIYHFICFILYIILFVFKLYIYRIVFPAEFYYQNFEKLKLNSVSIILKTKKFLA